MGDVNITNIVAGDITQAGLFLFFETLFIIGALAGIIILAIVAAWIMNKYLK